MNYNNMLKEAIILALLSMSVFSIRFDNLEQTDEELEKLIFPGIQTGALNIVANRVWDLNHAAYQMPLDFQIMANTGLGGWWV